MNKYLDVSSIVVRTAFIDSKNRLTNFKKQRFNLSTVNVLSVNEQKTLIQAVKKTALPKKYMCTGILESQVVFMNKAQHDEFDFYKVELNDDELAALEDEKSTRLNTFEHNNINNIRFRPTPLLISDLNEIVIVLREVSKAQIKTRRKRLSDKKSTTRKAHH